jgi:hypothetical protein
MFSRVLALGVGMVVALGMAEGTLRMLKLAPTGGVYTVTENEFGRIPGIFSPSRTVADHRIRALPHTVTTGRLGYRGRDFSAARTEDELRIFFTGDSFVFGDFVNDDETMPAVLERELAGQCGRVRVVNAGLGGSTIRDQYEMVVRGLILEPNLVIVGFSENDVQDLSGAHLWEQLARNRAAKSRQPLALLYPVLRETAFWNLALKATSARRMRHVIPEVQDVASSQGGEVARLRSTYRYYLAATRDTLRAHSIPMVFVIYPSHLTLNGEWSTEQVRWAESVGSELGIHTISFREPLAATGLGDDELYLLPHDGHPSPAGYAVAARHLGSRLRGEDPVSSFCAGR